MLSLIYLILLLLVGAAAVFFSLLTVNDIQSVLMCSREASASMALSVNPHATLESRKIHRYGALEHWRRARADLISAFCLATCTLGMLILCGGLIHTLIFNTNW